MKNEYPNFCPRNDAGHEPQIPRVFANPDGTYGNVFPISMNMAIEENDVIVFDEPTVWWPCKHCGLVFWEPREVALRKAEEARDE